MKLLLTSAGFTNKSIINALKELSDKPLGKTKLVFVPTAANVEEGDKVWLINDLVNCKKVGFESINIVDISVLPKDVWAKRIVDSDILMFGGGNTFHLMYWLEKTGLKHRIRSLLNSRIYVGISAGSMVVANLRLPTDTLL